MVGHPAREKSARCAADGSDGDGECGGPCVQARGSRERYQLTDYHGARCGAKRISGPERQEHRLPDHLRGAYIETGSRATRAGGFADRPPISCGRVLQQTGADHCKHKEDCGKHLKRGAPADPPNHRPCDRSEDPRTRGENTDREAVYQPAMVRKPFRAYGDGHKITEADTGANH